MTARSGACRAFSPPPHSIFTPPTAHGSVPGADGTLGVPVAAIAEKFIAYYWCHAAPFHLAGGRPGNPPAEQRAEDLPGTETEPHNRHKP